MSRVQLALNVADLDASVEFYSALFQVEPHKRRPGYANFQVNEPPLKLVLIETGPDARGMGTSGALNHLGIEVETPDEVQASLGRLQSAGLAVTEELYTSCCYAQQDKAWVHDPAGAPWEVYMITDDNPETAGSIPAGAGMNDGRCCTAGTENTSDELALTGSSCC